MQTDVVLKIRESFRLFDLTRKELSWNANSHPKLSEERYEEKPSGGK